MPALYPSLKDARAILDRAQIFKHLAEFDPKWVGSIPLNVHGPGADADICCHGGDLDDFQATLKRTFGHIVGYQVSDSAYLGERSIIAKFTIEALPIEVYGRTRPVETHESYIHWLAEDRLLKRAEEKLRNDVRSIKRTGLKTEPAFAQCLKLGGDPFTELLKLASPGDDALKQIIQAAGYKTR